MKFEQAFDHFMQLQMNSENNSRRKERLEKGLGHGEMEFLRSVWYPAVGHFEYLYPEWEVNDYMNGYRYLDLAFMPGDAKGAIEIQGYGSHARDIEVWRFKDLCMRHCHLSLDGWTVFPIAYPSIIEAPKQCQQLVLSIIGRFVSFEVPEQLTWLESETLRFARRLLRPFTPTELSEHLRVSNRYARLLLHNLVDKELLAAVNGRERVRSYKFLY